MNESQIARYLQRVSKTYRRGDASWYLYREMVRERGDYSTFDQVERLYAVLISWGMNSRGAKLASFEDFLDSIKKNRKTIEALSNFRIEKVESFDSPTLLRLLKQLFDSLVIAELGKPKFVAFSKTMHFLFPNFIAPMDRQYTLKYFHPSPLPKDGELQFELFKMIMEDYRAFIAEHRLEKYLDDRWNLSLPKICDNLVIGMCLVVK